MNLTRLGRFEIIREIGKGAMGQVFLANDPKIERKVAIKTIVLPPGTSEEEAHETSQRFLREAQAAGITEITARVSSDNPAAVALLRRTLGVLDIRLDGPELSVRAALA